MRGGLKLMHIVLCILELSPKTDTTETFGNLHFITNPLQRFSDSESKSFKYCSTALIRRSSPCFLGLCHMVPCLSISVSMCTHMLRCLSIIVFPFRLNLLFSSRYQRTAFTVISAWLRHGSNHCRSGVGALAQDRNATD